MSQSPGNLLSYINVVLQGVVVFVISSFFSFISSDGSVFSLSISTFVGVVVEVSTNDNFRFERIGFADALLIIASSLLALDLTDEREYADCRNEFDRFAIQSDDTPNFFILFKKSGENGFVADIDDAVGGFSESLNDSSLSL